MESNKKNKETLVIFGISIMAAFLFWNYGLRPFIVNGASMYPTFNSTFIDTKGDYIIKGDYLIINIFKYIFNDPKRFDVIVAKSPDNPKIFILKRVIALPGEEILLSENKVFIVKNGERLFLNETYVNKKELINYRNQHIRLGMNEYFVMGDNRNNSLDSRTWGALDRKNILGHTLFRIYPLNLITTNPGKVDIKI